MSKADLAIESMKKHDGGRKTRIDLSNVYLRSQTEKSVCFSERFPSIRTIIIIHGEVRILQLIQMLAFWLYHPQFSLVKSTFFELASFKSIILIP